MSLSRPVRIAPSLLAADFGALGDALHALEQAKIDMLHLDVMDGAFVPNISFGPPVIASLRPLTALYFDAHLMVRSPEHLFADFAQAGCQTITIHPEAVADVGAALRAIRALDCRAGLALNPDTSLDCLHDHLDHIDQILIMTVQPGFGGQPMLPLHDKIAAARAMIDATQHPIALQVDGGINPATASAIAQAGADILVAGTAIFGGTKNIARNIATLRAALANNQPLNPA